MRCVGTIFVLLTLFQVNYQDDSKVLDKEQRTSPNTRSTAPVDLFISTICWNRKRMISLIDERTAIGKKRCYVAKGVLTRRTAVDYTCLKLPIKQRHDHTDM